MSIVDHQEKDAPREATDFSPSSRQQQQDQQPMVIEQEEDREEAEAEEKADRREHKHSGQRLVEQLSWSCHASFPTKLWRILDDAERLGYDDVISWVDGGTAFQIHDTARVVPIVKRCFQASKYKSFLRQLQAYRFRRELPKITGRGRWRHEMFRRDSPRACARIQRDEPSSSTSSSSSNNNNKARRHRRRWELRKRTTAVTASPEPRPLRPEPAIVLSTSDAAFARSGRSASTTKKIDQWHGAREQLAVLERKRQQAPEDGANKTARQQGSSSVLEEARMCAALKKAEEDLSSLERRKLILQKHRQWTKGGHSHSFLHQKMTPQSVLMEARLCRDVEFKKFELETLRKREQQQPGNCGAAATSTSTSAGAAPNRTESELRNMLDLQQALLHQQRRTLELQTSLLKHRSSSEVAELLQQAESSTQLAPLPQSQAPPSPSPPQQQPSNSSLQIVSNALDVIGNAGAPPGTKESHPRSHVESAQPQQQRSRETSALQSLLLGDGDARRNPVPGIHGGGGDNNNSVIASLLKELDKSTGRGIGMSSSMPSSSTSPSPSSLAATENNLRMMEEMLLRSGNAGGGGGTGGGGGAVDVFSQAAAMLGHPDNYRQHASAAGTTYPIQPSPSYAQQQDQILSALTNSAERISNEELLNARLKEILMERMDARERSTREEENMLDAAVASLLEQQQQSHQQGTAGAVGSTPSSGGGVATKILDILQAQAPTPSADSSLIAKKALEILRPIAAHGAENSAITKRASEILHNSAQSGGLSSLLASSSLSSSLLEGTTTRESAIGSILSATAEFTNNASTAVAAPTTTPLSADLLQHFAETALLVQRASQAG